MVKIETPQGHGTGFLCLFNETKVWAGIATAYHVVEHADKWEEPIRFHHFPSNTSALIKEERRVVFPDPKTDSAVVLVPVGSLKLPEDLIPLRPIEDRLPIGVEVAWLGYPGLISDTLCFFAGSVSAWQEHRRAYLVDGVTVHGSSGGPVLYSSAADGVQIIGTVSAYMVNRATGESLPGLSVAQDVSAFHEITKNVRSIDEAIKRRQALEQQQQEAKPEPTPAP